VYWHLRRWEAQGVTEHITQVLRWTASPGTGAAPTRRRR
jgi:hypothetical protein